jgi:HAD superfamily hydrolase (TIGR01509 family)
MTSSGTSRTAVLLDIDGTLVESNYLHIDAWDRAFVEAGHPVDVWRIHRSIGMDSGKLLSHLLGDDAEQLGEQAKAKHSELYLASAGRLRPIPGARELLAALAERGHAVVLATSAPEDELKVLLRVLDADTDLAATTSGEDVGTAKPEPDIMGAALEKVSVDPARAVMIGDSTWDVEAALRAGLDCVALLSGGYGRAELLDAGAVAVYADVADLLANLEDSAIAGLEDAAAPDQTR